MIDGTEGSKSQGLQKNVSNAKRKFVAIGLTLVVACAFSYAAGMQQQKLNQDSQQYTGASVSEQLGQNNIQPTTNGGVNGQSSDSNAQYGQDTLESNGQIREGGQGGIMLSQGGRGPNGGNIIQQDNNVTSQSNGSTPQRCCATGKTGTCHAY